MGYNVGKSKNLIVNSEYLGNEVDNEKHFAKDKFTLTDKDGNKIYYELQSVKNSRGGSLEGYLITQTNIKAEDYNKLTASARKYFAEHPEERTSSSNSDAAITSDYSKILIQEAAAASFRGESGRRETNMEKLFLFQYSYLENINRNQDKISFLSWEQVIGQQDLGEDHIELSRSSIENDISKYGDNPLSDIFSDAWEKSADIGEKSLRERMRRDANAAISITKIGDNGQTMRVETNDKIPQTFDRDEANALIRYAIKRRGHSEK